MGYSVTPIRLRLSAWWFPTSDLIAWQLTQLHPAVSVRDREVTLPEEALHVKGQCLRTLLDAHIEILHPEQQRATLEEVYLETVQGESGS